MNTKSWKAFAFILASIVATSFCLASGARAAEPSRTAGSTMLTGTASDESDPDRDAAGSSFTTTTNPFTGTTTSTASWWPSFGIGGTGQVTTVSNPLYGSQTSGWNDIGYAAGTAPVWAGSGSPFAAMNYGSMTPLVNAMSGMGGFGVGGGSIYTGGFGMGGGSVISSGGFGMGGGYPYSMGGGLGFGGNTYYSSGIAPGGTYYTSGSYNPVSYPVGLGGGINYALGSGGYPIGGGSAYYGPSAGYSTAPSYYTGGAASYYPGATSSYYPGGTGTAGYYPQGVGTYGGFSSPNYFW